MAKPQVVVIPGAWHSPVFFATVISALESVGYTIHTRQLPAVGNPNPPEDLSQDTAAVQGLVEAAIGDGNDVVVVAHSWGGIVAGNSLEGYGKKDREAAGKKGGVVRAGYIAAFMMPEGKSPHGESGHKIPDWTVVEAPYFYATGPEPFYSDLPEAEQKYWFSKIQSHSLAVMFTPSTATSWKTIPTSYLLCELDQALLPAVQEMFINGARELGAEIEVTRIQAGHSPFLSKPEETVEWIRKVAGERI